MAIFKKPAKASSAQERGETLEYDMPMRPYIGVFRMTRTRALTIISGLLLTIGGLTAMQIALILIGPVILVLGLWPTVDGSKMESLLRKRRNRKNQRSRNGYVSETPVLGEKYQGNLSVEVLTYLRKDADPVSTLSRVGKFQEVVFFEVVDWPGSLTLDPATGMVNDIDLNNVLRELTNEGLFSDYVQISARRDPDLTDDLLWVYKECGHDAEMTLGQIEAVRSAQELTLLFGAIVPRRGKKRVKGLLKRGKDLKVPAIAAHVAVLEELQDRLGMTVRTFDETELRILARYLYDPVDPETFEIAAYEREQARTPSRTPAEELLGPVTKQQSVLPHACQIGPGWGRVGMTYHAILVVERFKVSTVKPRSLDPLFAGISRLCAFSVRVHVDPKEKGLRFAKAVKSWKIGGREQKILKGDYYPSEADSEEFKEAVQTVSEYERIDAGEATATISFVLSSDSPAGIEATVAEARKFLRQFGLVPFVIDGDSVWLDGLHSSFGLS